MLMQGCRSKEGQKVIANNGVITFLQKYFSGEAQDIMLRQSRLAQFYRHLGGKALILVPPTELEIFYQDLAAKALILVPTAELKIFYIDY